MNSSELTLAVRARQLMDQHRFGALATISVKHAGYPFASLVPYALDDGGSPLFFMSRLATHTRNAMANPHVSLMVCEGDSLQTGRVTMVGNLEQCAPSHRDAGLRIYMQRHPEAQQWASFDDFQLWRLKIVDVYFIAGFGVMGWIRADDW